MTKSENSTILGLTLGGFSGVLVGASAAIGFGMGRSFGRMACERLDILCLLYTSPSQRDGLLSRMPSSA